MHQKYHYFNNCMYAFIVISYTIPIDYVIQRIKEEEVIKRSKNNKIIWFTLLDIRRFILMMPQNGKRLELRYQYVYPK